MALTGVPYSVARRAELDSGSATESGLRRMLDAIEKYLAGRGRWLVPHGFKIATIDGHQVVFRLPVMWKPVTGAIIARASDEPSTANLDELRALFEEGLRSGDWLPGWTLVEWAPVMPDGPRPGNLVWTVNARVSR
jgi:hypothetical protein